MPHDHDRHEETATPPHASLGDVRAEPSADAPKDDHVGGPAEDPKTVTNVEGA